MPTTRPLQIPLSAGAEQTIQESADILNVYRAYLVKLLEEGEVTFHRRGRCRCVALVDLIQYREARRRKSEQAMGELAQQAQALGMGYG